MCGALQAQRVGRALAVDVVEVDTVVGHDLCFWLDKELLFMPTIRVDFGDPFDRE